MIKKYLKLFGLKAGFTLEDIKKAYRMLAKQHHPDHFNGEDEKKKQEIIMAGITEAYRTILSEFNASGSIEKHEVLNDNQETVKESDYTLYKKGLEFYKIYFDSFFKIFYKRNIIKWEYI